MTHKDLFALWIGPPLSHGAGGGPLRFGRSIPTLFRGYKWDIGPAEAALADVRAKMTNADFNAAFERGKTLDFDAAVANCLLNPLPDSVLGDTSPSAGSSMKRVQDQSASCFPVTD